jgi:MFS family permease
MPDLTDGMPPRQLYIDTGGVDVVTPPADSYGVVRAWYALVVFMIVLAVEAIDISIVTLLVHPIETAFRINDIGFAAITAIPVAVGISVAYYPSGLLADTIPRRYVLASGVTIWTLSAFVAARADSGTMLFFARLLAGIGTGIAAPSMLSMLTDAFSHTRRALALSLYSAGATVGGGAAITACAALAEMTRRNGPFQLIGIVLSPWQQCFVAVAAMGISVAILVLTLREPPRGERATLAKSSFISSLSLFGKYIQQHGVLWVLLLIGYAGAETSLSGINAWAPTFGTRHYGITGVAPIALLGTFRTAGSLVATLLAGLLVQLSINHGKPRMLPRLLIAASVISCVFAVSFPFMPSWLLAVACIACVTAASQSIAIFLLVGIQETTSNEVRGQLLGLFGITSFIPNTVGAAVVAFFASSVFGRADGLGPALALVGGMAGLLAMLAFSFAGRPYEQARPQFTA